MRKITKTFMILLAFILIVSMVAGCGGGNGVDGGVPAADGGSNDGEEDVGLTGKYTLVSWTSEDEDWEDVDFVDFFHVTSVNVKDVFIEFNSEGGFKMDFTAIDFGHMEGVFEVDGSTVTLTAEDEQLTGTIAGNKFTLGFYGDETIVFEKANNEVDYEITYSSVIAYKNSIGTVWTQAIFEVTNKGTSALYIGSGAYDLEDSDGKLISSSTMVSSYPDVIAPGERAYYYESTTQYSLDSAIDMRILPRAKADKAKVDLIRNNVTDLELSDDRFFGIRAKGRVENTSDEAQSRVYVSVILFDAWAKPIGVLSTILMEDLAPGDKIGFEATALSMPPSITTADVGYVLTYSYPWQLQF